MLLANDAQIPYNTLDKWGVFPRKRRVTYSLEERKHRRGDRKDGYLVREADVMHAFFPYLMPVRTANEAVLEETIDLTAIEAYLEKKNEGNPEFRYTFFHVICAAIAKTLALRPKMNRFYAGHRLYERKDLSLSFVVKRQFVDDSTEALAIVKVDRNSEVSPLEQIHEAVQKIVFSVRRENQMDGSTDKMGSLLRLPRPILRMAMRLLRWLEYHGRYPKSLMVDDPYYCSVFISNLGSIRMNANYHHLADWGTNSIFAVVGEKKPTPLLQSDGSVELRNTLCLSMTIDERIADGLYFAGSIRILKQLLQHPELLEQPTLAPLDEAHVSGKEV